MVFRRFTFEPTLNQHQPRTSIKFALVEKGFSNKIYLKCININVSSMNHKSFCCLSNFFVLHIDTFGTKYEWTRIKQAAS